MSVAVRNFGQVDWDAYAGAEGWSREQPPLILENGDWVVIADRHGMEAYRALGDEQEYYARRWEWNNWQALMILQGLASLPELTREAVERAGLIYRRILPL